MVTDLVCGMTIDPRRAMAKAQYDGTMYYFCTLKCHRAFTADPQKYINAAKSRRQSKSAPDAAGASADERSRMIAEAAYYRAQHRSFAPGGELEDWLSAEAEVNQALDKQERLGP